VFASRLALLAVITDGQPWLVLGSGPLFGTPVKNMEGYLVAILGEAMWSPHFMEGKTVPRVVPRFFLISLFLMDSHLYPMWSLVPAPCCSSSSVSLVWPAPGRR
jgi:hypothetical protein